MPGCVNCGAPLPQNSLVCTYCETRNSVDLRSIGGFSRVDQESQVPRICPCCDIPMKTISVQADPPVRIERCEQCHGLFFDPGELPFLIEHSVKNVFETDLFALSALSNSAKLPPRKRHYVRCPHCRVLMNQISYGQRSGIVIDWCKPDGIWLDSGELRSLLEWAKAGGNHLQRGKFDPHVSSPVLDDGSPPPPRPTASKVKIHGKKKSDHHFAIDLLDGLLDLVSHW